MIDKMSSGRNYYKQRSAEENCCNRDRTGHKPRCIPVFASDISLLPYHFYRQEQTLPLLYTPRSKHTRTNKSTLFSTECREKGASQRIHMAMPEPAQPGMFTSGTFQ